MKVHLVGVVAMAVALSVAVGASAGTDLRVPLTPPPDSLLLEAWGVAEFHEAKKGSLFQVEVKGLTLPGSYTACLGRTMDMSDHMHFALDVDADGEAELHARLPDPPSAYSGGHVCVGYHSGNQHVHVLTGMIP